jgi:hypothetical protein
VITQDHIGAARSLHRRLVRWQAIDAALASLASHYPGFGLEATLLKATCVNALYGTNVLALHRMVKHVVKVLESVDLTRAGPELIEHLAVPPQTNAKVHRHHSFASKFAHFFIDSQRFPIMDSYAVDMLKFHMGQKSMVVDDERPYVAFWQNHSLLKQKIRFPISNPELDHYLWIAGLYRKYQRNRNAEINREVQQLFENPDPAVSAELRSLSSYLIEKSR